MGRCNYCTECDRKYCVNDDCDCEGCQKGDECEIDTCDDCSEKLAAIEDKDNEIELLRNKVARLEASRLDLSQAAVNQIGLLQQQIIQQQQTIQQQAMQLQALATLSLQPQARQQQVMQDAGQGNTPIFPASAAAPATAAPEPKAAGALIDLTNSPEKRPAKKHKIDDEGVEGMEERVAELTANAAAKAESRIAELKKEVASKEKMIENLEAKIEDLEERVEELEDEADAGSTAWVPTKTNLPESQFNRIATCEVIEAYSSAEAAEKGIAEYLEEHGFEEGQEGYHQGFLECEIKISCVDVST
jgi:predicted nuclease with TOPRIM domain